MAGVGAGGDHDGHVSSDGHHGTLRRWPGGFPQTDSGVRGDDRWGASWSREVKGRPGNRRGRLEASAANRVRNRRDRLAGRGSG